VVEKQSTISLRWARDGAIIAVVLSVLALMLPSDWGGYNDWSDAHSVVHNLAAIATRIVVFALIGAALGFLRNGNRSGGIARTAEPPSTAAPTPNRIGETRAV
jgi:hypothetical protein